MARPRRIDFPHTLYHVFSRTVTGEKAFIDHSDENKFLFYLKKYHDIFSFRIHAFCLMPNHFHILMESKEQPALSEFMRRLLTAYTVWFNRRYGRHGHLFQGRFKSLVVDKSDYLLALSRYIHLNPARSRRPKDPETFRGSSLFYYINGGEPDFLYTSEILSWFQNNRSKYREYINEGLKEDIMADVLQQKYLGGKDFSRRMNQRLKFLDRDKSRANRAQQRHKDILEENNMALAERMLHLVSRYFDCPTESIMKTRYDHGRVGDGRLVYISLLRNHLPWSCRQIREHLGIRGSIHDHLNRLQKKPELMSIRDEISDELRGSKK